MNNITLFAYSQTGLAEQVALVERLGFSITDSASEDYDESGSHFYTVTMQFTGIPPCPVCEGACEVKGVAPFPVGGKRPSRLSHALPVGHIASWLNELEVAPA